MLSLFFKLPNTRKYQWKLKHCYIWLELKVIFCHHCKEYCASYISWYPMYRKWHLLEKAELNIYFPNYFPAKLPDKLHCPQDYPKVWEQRKILFSSIWYRVWVVLGIIFRTCPLGKKWLWGSHKISHKQCDWRSLENTILAHYLKGKTEVLNNHKPLSGSFKQNSFVTNSLKTCLENM